MKDILVRLSLAVEVLTQKKEEKSYFDDHPFTADRVDNINETIKGLDWKTKTWEAPDFPGPIDGLVFGNNPSKGVFQDNTFIQPDLNFAIDFPKGWKTENQPTTVGATHPDGNATIYLGLDDASKTPDQLAKEFEQRIEKEHGTQPFRSERYDHNGGTGYVISMTDNSGGIAMFIHILWVKMGDYHFKLIGVAPEELQEVLEKSAQSLRILSAEDKKTVEIQFIKVVEVQSEESWEKLSERTGNQLKPDLTALINGYEVNTKPPARKKVKIIQKQNYRPR